MDVSNEDGLTAATHAVPKTLFLDLVAAFTDNGIAANRIPAKIEGIAFGPDVRVDHHTRIHTLWVSNDNDFLLFYRRCAAGTESEPVFCIWLHG